jgi:hypothetical protein
VHAAVGLPAGGESVDRAAPAPQRLTEELIKEGRTIPIARVQAMHEGKLRVAARRAADANGTARVP